MIAAIRLWFVALTQREKWLVAGAGILVGLILGIFGILLPVLSIIDQAHVDHDEAVQRRGRIVATVDAAQKQQIARPSAVPRDINLQITQAAAEKGFDLVKAGNAAPGQISFRIDQARAPALLTWLTELEAQNIMVRGMSLRTGANGTIQVDAQMQTAMP